MIWAKKEDIVKSHSLLIKQFGGLDGVLKKNALDSALNNPLQSFGGVDFYPSDLEKIIRLSYNIVTEHPFCDGNKRSGANTLCVLAKLNKFESDFTQEEIINLFMGIASGKTSYEKFKDKIIQKSMENENQLN